MSCGRKCDNCPIQGRESHDHLLLQRFRGLTCGRMGLEERCFKDLGGSKFVSSHDSATMIDSKGSGGKALHHTVHVACW